MSITIKATNTTLTQAIKNAISDKFSVLDMFLRSEDKIHVEAEVDKKHKSGLVYRVEVTIKPHGHYAEARGNDFYEAVDLLIPKIKSQFTKAKAKKISLRRKDGRKAKRD
jgi:ribosomal subunit interface protein